MACLYKQWWFGPLHQFYQRERSILGMFNELSAHLAVQHLDVSLPSVLTTHYYVPQQWQTLCYTRFVALRIPLI